MSDPVPVHIPTVAARTRPRAVRTASVLFVASIVLQAVTGVAIVTASSSPDPGPGPETVAARVLAMLGPALDAVVYILVAVLIGLYLLFVTKMWAGQGWARVVLSVVGTIVVVLGGGGLGFGVALNPLTVIVVANYLVIAAAIVFMFLPAANPYFRKR